MFKLVFEVLFLYFFLEIYFWFHRLGPSASQTAGDDDKVAEIVKALSLLSVTMKQPWCRDLMTELGFCLPGQVPEDQELNDAKDGKPSGSRPSGSTPVSPAHVPAPKPAPTPTPPTPPEETPSAPPAATSPEVPEPTTGAEKPEDPGAGAVVINSSTHRAAHARLQRRMHSLGEAECPNMAKLWAGSRKDFRCFWFEKIC